MTIKKQDVVEGVLSVVGFIALVAFSLLVVWGLTWLFMWLPWPGGSI